MKKLISETDGYRVFADLSAVPDPNGYFMLKVSSQWDNAKNPEEEQTRFTALLSPDAVRAYQQLFTQAIK